MSASASSDATKESGTKQPTVADAHEKMDAAGAASNAAASEMSTAANDLGAAISQDAQARTDAARQSVADAVAPGDAQKEDDTDESGIMKTAGDYAQKVEDAFSDLMDGGAAEKDDGTRTMGDAMDHVRAAGS